MSDPFFLLVTVTPSSSVQSVEELLLCRLLNHINNPTVRSLL
jgi:hypothetical protein